MLTKKKMKNKIINTLKFKQNKSVIYSGTGS